MMRFGCWCPPVAHQVTRVGGGLGSSSSGDPSILLATDYGVVGDGVTNDSAALQLLFDAAEALTSALIFINIAGDMRIETTLTLNDTGTDKYISIEGLSEAKTRLVWHGSTSGIALKISRNKYFTISRLGVLNGVAEGTTVGISLTGPTDTGTQTLSGSLDHVAVSLFNTGISAGQYTNFAASEISYRHVTLNSNGTGWRNGSLNTLDHVFDMLLMDGNDIGLDIGSGNAYVRGGSSTQNIIDFQIGNAGSTFEIANYRSEGAARTRFLQHVGNGFQLVRVVGCMIVGKGADSDIAIETDLGNSQLALLDNQIDGRVELGNGAAHASCLTMQRNVVFGATAVYAPSGAYNSSVILPFFVTGNNANDRSRVFLQGNVFHDIDSGTADFNYDDVYGGNFQDGGKFFPGIIRTNDVLPTDTTRLVGVSTLSQAPFGEAGKNLRLTAKFATSATLAALFKRVVTVDTTNGVEYVDSSAAFFPGDVGRKISIANADGIGGVFIGRITHFDNASRVYFTKQAGTPTPTTGTGRTATIGEDEPNANYLVFVTGSAQEMFSISSKATTGFTVTSSNASSTATVDLLIVR